MVLIFLFKHIWIFQIFYKEHINYKEKKKFYASVLLRLSRIFLPSENKFFFSLI